MARIIEDIIAAVEHGNENRLERYLSLHYVVWKACSDEFAEARGTDEPD